MDKKIYQAPSVELCILRTQEDLLTMPSVSDTGYGWADQGPVTAVNGDL